MHQSSCAPTPLPPPATVGHLPGLLVPGGWALANLARGMGISQPRGHRRKIKRVCFLNFKYVLQIVRACKNCRVSQLAAFDSFYRWFSHNHNFSGVLVVESFFATVGSIM